MITFDKLDVEASGQYLIIHDYICFTSGTYFYTFQNTFVDNFMIGLVEFSSPKTAACISFINIMKTINSTYGI